MSQRFDIPGRLMGRNDQERAARAHWSQAARLKREEQERVGWAIREAGVKPVDGPIEIGFNFIESSRLRDPDNVIGGATKVVLDAMKEHGIISDDNPRIVRNLFFRFAYGAEEPHVEVEIMDYSPNGRTVYYPPVQGLETEEKRSRDEREACEEYQDYIVELHDRRERAIERIGWTGDADEARG